jgi:aspartyl-tRNA(Asn)/glutamyl-tRNA(Gln) amidotransferase subunit A
LFVYHSISSYHKALLNGTVTTRQAVQHFLQQIEAQQALNAFIDVYAGEALHQADALDAQLRTTGNLSGPLHGVVIGLKDVICYKDHPVSAASRILGNFTSLYNATAVQRLLDAGAIIIGRLNCDEFGMGSTNENSAYGPVLHPTHPDRVPGGSSGGSAAAVKAGLCMASLGSDTGGSVRQPADFCGIVGLKPGYGRISRYGLIAYASSFDQIGILALNVADAAQLLEVMAGPDAYDSTASQHPVDKYAELEASDKKYRIAYIKEALHHPANDPEISAGIQSFLTKLEADGHTVEGVGFELLDYIVPAYYIQTTAEASSNLSRYDGVKFGYRSAGPRASLDDLYKQTRSEGFGDEVKRRIMLGTFVLSAGYYDAYYTRAQQVRQLLVQQTAAIFSRFDVIILPVSPSVAFKKGEKLADPVAMYLADIYTVYANLVGVPAISLPLFQHSSGLPFSLQVLAARHNELPLLRFSYQLMRQYKVD